MKKNKIFYLASTILLAGGLLASCGNKQKEESTQTQIEQEAFSLDEKTTTVDSLKEIDEMVSVVESEVPGINGTKYNAAFFNNEDNKGAKASADQYAQTPSGLKYVIVNQGKGKTPNATDIVTVHYVGTLTDGTQFDSSIDRGEPAQFPLNRVIPGWTEGLQLMQEGGTAVFYLPYEIAYGEQDSVNPYTGEVIIPQKAPLIFWVQLIQVGQ